MFVLDTDHFSLLEWSEGPARQHLLQVLGFDERAGAEFKRLRAARLRIGAMDLKIAAIAITHDAIVQQFVVHHEVEDKAGDFVIIKSDRHHYGVAA